MRSPKAMASRASRLSASPVKQHTLPSHHSQAANRLDAACEIYHIALAEREGMKPEWLAALVAP